MVRCPAHGDKTASLSVRLGDDGRVLLHCFGGCSFNEIVAALGIEARQLFPSAGGPWRPRAPRPDPDAEARAFLDYLAHLREAPPPDRMRKELVLIGRLLLGGTNAFRELPPDFRADRLKTFPLRLVFQAIEEVAMQGTPRRWFSPLALAREVERVGGQGLRADIFFWRRVAIGAARWDA